MLVQQYRTVDANIHKGNGLITAILAPLLFSLYMLSLSQIMRKKHTQIYLALSPNDYSPIDSLCQYIDEINS